MNIQPIVEGHGEVEAVPVLLRRLRDEAGAFEVEVGRPIRQPRNHLISRGRLERAVELALLQENCAAILILMDADDDCPKEFGPKLQTWANHVSRDVPCTVVLANREYEAWFLASMHSLRGRCGISESAVGPLRPDEIRDAKGTLEAMMPSSRSYRETVDQAKLTAWVDLPMAYQMSRSFRKLTTSFGTLLRGMGALNREWPPSVWSRALTSD